MPEMMVVSIVGGAVVICLIVLIRRRRNRYGSGSKASGGADYAGGERLLELVRFGPFVGRAFGRKWRLG